MKLYFVFCIIFIYPLTLAEDGYDLWLRYQCIGDSALLTQYRTALTGIVVQGSSPTYTVIADELHKGLKGLLGRNVPVADDLTGNGTLIASTPADSSLIASLNLSEELSTVGSEGFRIKNAVVNNKSCIVIAANRPIGVLYGSYHFLRLLQTHQAISNLDIRQSPKIPLRLLNHWDNLDGTVERGYSGNSLWKWNDLPGTLDLRYVDYARACASIGINGMIPNNVNASSNILTTAYIQKLAALSETFRPYGIKVFLTAKFSAPKEIGGLATADPLDSSVIHWWDSKVKEIYRSIPDFGGFLIKADSEGQPGPQDYGRSHAEGANMLAKALLPYGGLVMWRAFVYGSEHQDPDRVKQAYEQFVPLDGQFNENVFLQVKNGPLDFQPREPVNPLFGAMPKTRLSIELQITQEYLGHSTYLNYLAPMWKEILDSDSYTQRLDTTVSGVTDGSAHTHPVSAIAGVANTGSDRNWCGHHFAQANWYAFGRLAWNTTLDSRSIAEEWTRMTFTNEPSAVDTIVAMMMGSWEASVDVMTPLGLNTLCNAGSGESGHYTPAPASRAKFHKADSSGLGYDRTSDTGSNAVGQYAKPLRTTFNQLGTCPEKYLLWFHHVSWNHTMSSGRSLWDELCYRYTKGVCYVRDLNEQWVSLQSKIDPDRFAHVRSRLADHLQQATLWRDTCTAYFQGFSGQPISELEPAPLKDHKRDRVGHK